MSRSESWKAWTAIIIILLFSGFVAAIWPYLSSSLGGGVGSTVPVEAETVTITIPPIPMINFEGWSITLNGFVIFFILAAVVIGAVVVTGVVITGINYLLARQVKNTQESEKYLEGSNTLEQKEKSKLSEKREGRAADKSQQNDYSRWAVIATSLAILMFAIFLGYLVGSTFYPTGEILEQDEIVNITGIIILAFVLITLFFLFLRMNPRKLAAVDDTDHAGIPWETITVILLGIIVVGLGIGLVVFLNNPI